MEIFKNFTLGGLFQAGRRMAPPWGAFRRFTNTYTDPAGTLKPYGRGEPVNNNPGVGADYKGPISSQVFRMGILQLHAYLNGGPYLGVLNYVGPDDLQIPIMQPFSIPFGNQVNVSEHMAKRPSGNLSSCTVARKAYMCSMVNDNEFNTTSEIGGWNPKESYMLAFDGLRVRGAGLPTPWTFASQGLANGNHYLRAIHVTIGMDGELISSPYYQLQLQSASADVYLGGYSAYPATKRAKPFLGFSPTYRDPRDTLFEEVMTGQGTYTGWGAAGSNARYFDKRYVFIAPAAITVVAGELTFTGYDTISAAVRVGDWLMLDSAFYGGHISMFKVKSINTGTKTIVFERYYKELGQNTVTWEDKDFKDVYDTAVAIDIDLWFQIQGGITNCLAFTNIFMLLYYSTSASSGYVLNQRLPVCWDSAHSLAGMAFSAAFTPQINWCGVVTGALADWYDANTVKATFPPLKGITCYKELLVGHDSKALYFTDVSLGGSTEMVSGLSNIVPFGTEYGDIVAICGTEDFLLVSRERKNYVITGDIAGSSFNITEVDQAVPGAYNSRAVTNAWSGQAILMNASGIFAVNNNASITDIGEEIKGLFFDENRDGNLFDSSIFKLLTDTRAAGRDGAIFKLFLDDSRAFVILFTAKVAANHTVSGANMLVYNTKTKKWYEFEAPECMTAEALYGTIRTFGLEKFKEDGVMRDDEKQLLVTQRMTVDQPSLEKQICQLKFFGEITPDGTGKRAITVGQINDWQNFDTADRSNWNTNVVYEPKDHEVYAHKKRFDSSKAVTTSAIMESIPGGSFTVEGMEIEGVIAQQGMKK